MNTQEIAHVLDHTLLKPTATDEDIVILCKQAMQWGFASVAIHPLFLSLAHQMLKDSDVGITVALAYPHGAWDIALKCREMEEAVTLGATDCDYVINIGALRDRRYEYIAKEVDSCRKAAGNMILKAILEVSLLTDEEIATACAICAEHGCDFVKTSTGFVDPPSFSQITVMLKSVEGSNTRVKAAGGFSDAKKIMKTLDMGVARIGTSSSVKVMHELTHTSE